ncbi:MAG TPA: NTP transferase domain-containing protein [Acidimicrobiales bacterium]
MQLVVLAAGHGRRFGGLKQLAPVGPNGEAIMDYTVTAAASCGFTGVVVVVREEILAEMQEHAEKHFPSSLKTEFAIQGPRRGTAEAVACTAPFIEGPFAVANADDLYAREALEFISAHFLSSEHHPEISAQHLLVGYQILNTILTASEVKRGLINVGSDGSLERIVETLVKLRIDGRFDATALHHEAVAPSAVLTGNEYVSMNLWGFHPRVFAELEDALAKSAATEPDDAELLLPDVVAALIASGRDRVHVARTESRCIGITNPEDFALVKDELSISPLDAVARSRSSQTG